jgi:UDP-glucose 4-epimerase
MTELRVVVTGASGFIGTHLTLALANHGFRVDALVRRQGSSPRHRKIRERIIADLTAAERFQPILQHATHVVHLASTHAGTHQAQRELHVEVTKRLFEAANEVGAKQFIYASTLRAVAGESCEAVIGVATPPRPTSLYGRLKSEAERWLIEQRIDGSQPIILRLPMVYGENGGANFERLVRWVVRGRPVPISQQPNRRSMLHMNNLTDFVIRLVEDEPNPTQIIQQISDARILSTAELAAVIGQAAGMAPRIWTLPQSSLNTLKLFPIVRPYLARLTESLVLEIDTALEWQPPYDTENAIEQAVASVLLGMRT